MDFKVRSARAPAEKSVPLPLSTLGILGVTLLGLALGGSTELWAQVIIGFLAALLIFVFPARRLPGLAPMIMLLIFMALALAAFLPVNWGYMSEWRRHLMVDLHAPLGSFRTAQPWLTLQWCCLLFFGVLWTAYLLTQDWSNAQKSNILRVLATGVVFLAAALIVSYLTGYRVPGWNQEENRGWFPNRNQSADVLAMIGIVAYAFAFRALQNGLRAAALWWLIGLTILGASLVICLSRAGILMFFAGIVFWHLASFFRPQKFKTIAIGGTILLLLLSLFLLFGNSTVDRFLKDAPSTGQQTSDFRILIQEDALRLSLQEPFLGVGLGNFEPVFTSMRQLSADQNRILHPESDWLWLAVEMGWLAPLLILAGVKWWTGECFPFVVKQGESIRRAAMVATLMFLAHGFVDVSGHRPGSAFVGLLMASLALAPRSPGVTRIWIAPLFRGFAAILGIVTVWWAASIYANWGPPTSATLDRLEARINENATAGKIASVSEAANAALKISPLNWTYYLRRASAEAFRTGGTQSAATDFAIGRALEPNSIDVCMYEGQVWLGADEPKLCLEAWHEALRRAGPKRNSIYWDMLSLSQSTPDIHHGLADVTPTNPDYLIMFLNFATPLEAKSEVNGLLARDPNLTSFNFNQQKKLFDTWYAHGDRDALASLLLTHSQLQMSGWKYLAQHFADKQDFELAVMTTLRFLPEDITRPLSRDQLAVAHSSNFDSHPDDSVEGIKHCQAQIQDDDLDGALETISKLERIKDCPRLIFYLKAEIFVKKQSWEQAWNSLQQLHEP